MLLTYSHKQFPPFILGSIKIHTIRQDKNNRWKPGNSIQHWMHNPRNKSKNPYPFAAERPDLNTCISIQSVSMIKTSKEWIITIDGRELPKERFEEFAINDGFTSFRQMTTFITESISNWKIIHWTDFKY